MVVFISYKKNKKITRIQHTLLQCDFNLGHTNDQKIKCIVRIGVLVNKECFEKNH